MADVLRRNSASNNGMNSFSEFEKNVIRKLIELDQKPSLVTLSNVIDLLWRGPAYDNFYIAAQSPHSVVLCVKKDCIDRNDIAGISDAEHVTSKSLIPTVLLLERLKKNGLAYFTDDLNITVIGKKYSCEDY